MALFSKLPGWASILITVVAAIIVVGLVSWGTYTLVKPGPSKLPEGEKAVEGQETPITEDQFKDWKTYRNEEYGFEFKYPPDWKLDKALSNSISFTKETEVAIPKTISFSVTIYDNTNNISLENFYTRGLNISDECVESSEILTISNNKVIRILDKCGLSAITSFLIAKNQKVFILGSIYSAPIDQILSTFRFID